MPAGLHDEAGMGASVEGLSEGTNPLSRLGAHGRGAQFPAYPSIITFFRAKVNRQIEQIFSRNFVLDIWVKVWYYNHVKGLKKTLKKVWKTP